ncbi:hypothetical protein L798_01837 [Zootermopsis nevadensis]|uniref:Uncharacterized protein n=1 Tax=Zootermopsis nevadensis TaxID=136037 RepID=A0A067REE5_ZOONE|nr:hypothetical protein L798_01837 [Zootermopsis nevadensis]
MGHRFFWTQRGKRTGMSSNRSEQRKFSNVSTTKRSRRRRIYVAYPTVLSSSSPCVIPQLYHNRPRISLNALRCPLFKMQKRKKKFRGVIGRKSVRFLKTRNDGTLMKNEECVA